MTRPTSDNSDSGVPPHTYGIWRTPVHAPVPGVHVLPVCDHHACRQLELRQAPVRHYPHSGGPAFPSDDHVDTENTPHLPMWNRIPEWLPPLLRPEATRLTYYTRNIPADAAHDGNCKTAHYSAYRIALVLALASRGLLKHLVPATVGPPTPEKLGDALQILKLMVEPFYPALPWEAVRPAHGGDFAAHTAAVDAWIFENA